MKYKCTYFLFFSYLVLIFVMVLFLLLLLPHTLLLGQDALHRCSLSSSLPVFSLYIFTIKFSTLIGQCRVNARMTIQLQHYRLSHVPGQCFRSLLVPGGLLANLQASRTSCCSILFTSQVLEGIQDDMKIIQFINLLPVWAMAVWNQRVEHTFNSAR